MFLEIYLSSPYRDRSKTRYVEDLNDLKAKYRTVGLAFNATITSQRGTLCLDVFYGLFSFCLFLTLVRVSCVCRALQRTPGSKGLFRNCAHRAENIGHVSLSE